MREKIKNFNLSSVFNIVKASLIGVVFSIILVLGFAFVLNFVDLSSTIVSLVSQIIKIISIFITVIILNKGTNGKLIIKGVIAGALYYIFTFVIFSLLNGAIAFSGEIVSDVVFSAIIGAISAVIVNLLSKK